jgi:hypothetical protein
MLELRHVGTATITPEMARAATGLSTLEDVIRRRELSLLDVIVQDEYTHDVVVEAARVFLVFDST